jgi:hypothetical protein
MNDLETPAPGFPLTGSYNVGAAVVGWTVDRSAVVLALLLNVDTIAEQLLTPAAPNWIPDSMQVGNDSIVNASFTAIFPGGDQLGGVAINTMRVNSFTGSVSVQNVCVCAWTTGGQPIYNHQQ